MNDFARTQMSDRFTDMTDRNTLSAEQNGPHMPQAIHIYIHEHVEKSGRNERNRNPLPFDQLGQLTDFQHDLSRNENEARPVDQSAENVGNRPVKRITGQLENPVLLRNLDIVRIPCDPDNVPVGHQVSFRLPGRPRGIDHTGQIGRFVDSFQFRPVRVVSPLVIQYDHGALDGNPFLQMTLRQHNPGARVFDEVPDTFFRVFRIDRHISAAGFQHGHNADDHLDGTIDNNAYETVPADFFAPKRTCQAIRPLIQLAVRKFLLLKYDRHCIRYPLRLFLKQLMKGFVPREIRRCVVERFNNLRFFSRRCQLQVAHFDPGIVHDLFEHVQQLSPQTLDVRFRKYTRIVIEAYFNGFSRNDRHIKIVIRLFRHLDIRDSQTAGLAAARLLHLLVHRIVFERDNVVDKILFLGASRLDLIQRIIIVAAGFQRLLLHFDHDVGKRRVRLARYPHRYRVDEKSDHLLDSRNLSRSSRDDAAEDRIARPVNLLQNDAPCRLQQGVQRDMLLLGRTLHPFAQAFAQLANDMFRKKRSAFRIGLFGKLRLSVIPFQIAGPVAGSTFFVLFLQPLDVLVVVR